MSQYIDAIFENGVLKPLVPLHLPEQSRVKITIEETALAETSEQSPADNSSTTDEMGYPAGYFETTAGSFANEPLERPQDLPSESRESW